MDYPSNPIECREKAARALYFLVRYMRTRLNRYKLTVKDYIRWHRLSQLLEKVERSLRSAYRFLWFGTFLFRLVALRKRIKSGELLSSLEIGYRTLMFVQDIAEDALTISLFDSQKPDLQPGAPVPTDIWGIPRGTPQQQFSSALSVLVITARVALVRRTGKGGVASWLQLLSDAFLAGCELHASYFLNTKPVPDGQLLIGCLSSVCASVRSLA